MNYSIKDSWCSGKDISKDSKYWKFHLKCISTRNRCLVNCVASDYVALPGSEGNNLGTSVGHITGMGIVGTLPTICVAWQLRKLFVI